jgi:phytoene desaturase
MKRAVVIGAGFGGLALAIRLQSAGVATTIVEGRERPGGRAYVWHREGHVFDAGPTVITDPACLEELWMLSGRHISDHVDLMPVDPFYRLIWDDGATFDYGNDDAALERQIRALDPADWDGYRRFLDYARGVYREGYVGMGSAAFLDFKSMLRAAPQLARYQAWRSVYSMVSSFVKNEKLREALSFHTLLVGGDPMKTSAIYALIHALERQGGVWFPRGGTNALVSGMVRLFKEVGGTIRCDDPVVHIESLGNRVTAVTTRSGWRQEADAVATNADIVHSYRDLMPDNHRARRVAEKLVRKRFSPSLFVVYFGLKTPRPEVSHHSILFGPRYKGLLADIYDHGVLSQDFSLYVHHPTATDPSLAPDGGSTFYALSPVPHMGKLPIDWAVEGPKYRDRILDRLEERLIPNLRRDIGPLFHFGPAEFAGELNAHLGSAFSLEPLLTQSAWFRVHNRDDDIRNLYFVGAGTHPGAGIPGVVGSAKATARLMLEEQG